MNDLDSFERFIVAQQALASELAQTSRIVTSEGFRPETDFPHDAKRWQQKSAQASRVARLALALMTVIRTIGRALIVALFATEIGFLVYAAASGSMGAP